MEEHHLHVDVLVAGGGPAGVGAALSAARNGVRVLLVQDRPMLGGNASSEIRMHMVGANGGRHGIPLVAEARESGLVEEIRLDVCVQNPQRAPSMLDLVLYDKCRLEPNLEMLLNTTVVAAEVKGGVIQRVKAERQSTEDRFWIDASAFIDATGDGRLGLEAGATFQHGREGSDEYDEQLAVSIGDRQTLGSTLLYQAKKHERPMPFKAPAWARKFKKEELRLRPFGVPGMDLNLEFGFWWVEWGGTLDTIKDNEAIRDELLAILLGVWDFIKNESEVDAENWALEWFGFVPGKRESRRFHCLKRLKESDLLQSRKFADAIAYGGWPIDQHPPAGVDAPDEPPCDQVLLPYLYDIPLSCCISKDVKNLYFAGRNIGATHVAFASTRVMATCMTVGQGVGVAAACGVRQEKEPAELLEDRISMNWIQQRLLRQDAFLLGKRNEDPEDFALKARASASSAQEEGPAERVLSGVTRSTHGGPLSGEVKEGAICAAPGRVEASTHRWMSEPGAGFPAWLQLEWEEPQWIREVQVTFDTGLHRLLTLSMADGYTEKMEWGRPQPETVRDYRIQVATEEGDWKDLLVEKENYQRVRVHRFELQQTTAVRILVEATNGLDHARVVEMRVY